MARTRDPALTLAWLRAPAPITDPKRFAVDWGRIQYSQLMQSSRTHKRYAYLTGATCEIEDCESGTDTAFLVFDHCHRHGWVRAVLCNSHNVRIAHLEAAWLHYDIVLSRTPYWPVLMSCEGCRAEANTKQEARDE